MRLIILSLFTFFTVFATAQDYPEPQKEFLVSNISEFNERVKSVNPGDAIVLANGTWNDAELVFTGKGTEEQPIILKAQERGKVILEGESSLKIGGEFLIVDGLYFTNGYTPGDAVIQFRVDKRNIANNSRVTNCVIENFTQPRREIQDHWIELYGRNNRFDHNYIAGKSNSGPTMRVFLKGNENIYTHHQIVNNFFGPRPRKGGPHAETLQIGSSETSMTPAYVNVSENMFYRCNGEVEIISSKSNFNEFNYNVFFESEGSLVLRHGNYARINGNKFIGNDNSEFIGGIRVINTGHWITNNYFYKLKGSEFRSPLAVMNGIPKSPLNRYNQVTDVVVAYNSFIDSKSPWHFSVGSNVDKSDVLPASEIRSARPERVILANNLVYDNNPKEPLIVAYDEVDGVTFRNNYLNYQNNSEVQDKGIITKNFNLKQVSEYLYVPEQEMGEVYKGFNFESIDKDLLGNNRDKNNSVGAISLPVENDAVLFEYSQYGPAWFSPTKTDQAGKIIQVSDAKTLQERVNTAKPGDIIELASGSYKIDRALTIDKNLTIRSRHGKKPRLEFEGPDSAAFEMNPKAKLRLENVMLKGNSQKDAFRSLDENMAVAFNLWIKDAEIDNFNSLLKVSKGAFADTISVANSKISNLNSGINLAEEIDDKGEYNAEFVYITNSSFENVKEEVLNYYRGGYDESTIGGSLVFTGNTIKNSGTSTETEILLRTRGIVNVEMANNTFIDNPVKFIAILWGAKGQEPVDNTLKNSGEIKVEENLKQKLMY
jgi:poly(beta-D-mannuronate) lyase